MPSSRFGCLGDAQTLDQSELCDVQLILKSISHEESQAGIVQTNEKR
jgi:hypothetical protein